MEIRDLKQQHWSIIDKAAILGGLCRLVRSRDDALEARRLIAVIDLELVAHLTLEDEDLYPVLLNAQDEGLRLLGAEAIEGIGGLLEIWVRFRDCWTESAILADPRGFAAATDFLMRALSVRVEMEEDSLYPAAEAASRLGGRIAADA